MRKLLNTLYITQEQAFLSLDGENLVCLLEDEKKFRIPFDNVESIVCFSYLGCSPAVMGKCVEKLIPISFMSPHGRFLARVGGGTRGNVHLRMAQIHRFEEQALALSQNTMAAKFANTIQLIRRTQHDTPPLREDSALISTVDALKRGIGQVYEAQSVDEVIGIEGNCAHRYFQCFDRLITNPGQTLTFHQRSKRPPLDPVNAVLSFLYTLHTNEYAAALETVGLDSYIGFCHALRSGRSSLACDLVEETRCIAERQALTLLNLRMLSEADFTYQPSGAVYLNEDGRKKVITAWQERKRTDIVHPYLGQKIQLGLLPYVQSNLLAKFVRGELEEYPCFLQK